LAPVIYLAFVFTKSLNMLAYVKVTRIYIAPNRETSRRSCMDHTVMPDSKALPRKRSPDGDNADCAGRHLITAYYSFMDPKMTKG